MGKHCSRDWVRLSPSQREIYDLLENQGLSVSDVADRRQTTPQAVYKIKAKLKKYGWKVSARQGGLKKLTQVAGSTPGIKTQPWRAHAFHFLINPYYFFRRYTSNWQGEKIVQYREWTVKLHKNSLEMQLAPGVCFEHEDGQISLNMASDCFTKRLNELASKYGFEVWKEGRASISLVNYHFAKIGTPTAQTIQEKVQIQDSDGKVFLLIDASKGPLEQEYIGKNTTRNWKNLEPHLQQMAENPHLMKPEEVTQALRQVVDLHLSQQKLNEQHTQAVVMLTTALASLIKLQSPQPPQEPQTEINTKRPDYIG